MQEAETDQLVIEPQCCDGSDELPGVCKDVCKETGEDYRKALEAEMKLRKTVCRVLVVTSLPTDVGL